MIEKFIGGADFEYLIRLFFSLIAGILIGWERVSRGKAAGATTHSFVIGGSMTFSFLSFIADPNSPARISAQIVSGVGFLGAGIILKREEGKIVNLTTAASIWFSAAIGMLIGYGFYLSSIMAVLFSVFLPRIPHLPGKDPVVKAPVR